MKRLRQWHKRLLGYPHVSFGLRLLFLLLLPASLLYGAVTWVRNCAYDRGWLPSYRSRLPVISVGNLAAGGTGKTPTVDFIVKDLIGQGWSPAIVSRGYGGTYRGRAGYVQKNGQCLMTAREAGDEPYLLARRNPRSIVMVARRRVDAIRILEGDQQGDVVILDDGFQHRAVKRDVDIVLLDAQTPFGNRWPLPAGNLREWPDALQRADLLLVTRGRTETDLHWTGLPVFQSRHRLSGFGVSLDGERVPLADLKNLKLCAFAGIASPESFFSPLEGQGLNLVHKIAYPDHVQYNKRNVAQLTKVGQAVDALVTTEKDAVKFEGAVISTVCYIVEMDLEIGEPDRFRSALVDTLRRL